MGAASSDYARNIGKHCLEKKYQYYDVKINQVMIKLIKHKCVKT